MKASARKSFGEYKPIIIHASGRTEILGQKVRPLIWVPGQAGMHPLPGGPTHKVRGKTFPTREQAVAYAERAIERRVAGVAAYKERFAAIATASAQ